MKHIVIINGLIYQGLKFIKGKSLFVENGRISQITSRKPPKNYECIDASGCYILPGFIDLHLHCDLTEKGSKQACEEKKYLENHLQQISFNHARFGTTRFLATFCTSSDERLKIYAEALNPATRQSTEVTPWSFSHRISQNGAQILGIHLEGPFLNRGKAGAQPKEYIFEPNPKILENIFGTFGKKLRLMTLAPELKGIDKIISTLIKKKVLVSIGHSDATCEEANQGIKQGIRYATHLFNQMRGIHHRELGAVGAVLLDDRVFAEIICDGIHVHPLMIKWVTQVKALDKIVLATDCFTHLLHEDNVPPPYLPNGVLAGSALSLRRAIVNLVKFTGLKFEKAVLMATRNPAKALGIDRDHGSLEPGKVADVVLMDKKMNVKMTMVEGKTVYRIS